MFIVKRIQSLRFEISVVEKSDYYKFISFSSTVLSKPKNDILKTIIAKYIQYRSSGFKTFHSRRCVGKTILD
jgi:hypothetical protein